MEGSVPSKGRSIDITAVLEEEVDQDEVFSLYSVMEGGPTTTGVLEGDIVGQFSRN